MLRSLRPSSRQIRSKRSLPLAGQRPVAREAAKHADAGGVVEHAKDPQCAANEFGDDEDVEVA